MGFGPRSFNGADRGVGGEIDYRLARAHLIAEYRRGRLAQHEVCDAHPELIRAATQVARPTTEDCPICERDQLVLVSYVFGPKLPAFGRCITTAKEMKAFTKRSADGDYVCYVVEVCPSCRWNHLARTFLLNPARSA